MPAAGARDGGESTPVSSRGAAAAAVAARMQASKAKVCMFVSYFCGLGGAFGGLQRPSPSRSR
jgi:hypothetical protein